MAATAGTVNETQTPEYTNNIVYPGVFIMKFVKMQGCGNDYIYIRGEEMSGMTGEDRARFVRKVCDRHFGIGADGVILIHSMDGLNADFEMEVYNADGSRAGMCGNGILCVGRYVYEQGMTGKKELRIASGGVTRTVWLYPDSASTVRVNMGKPEFLCKKIPVIFPKRKLIGEKVEFEGREYHMTCVSMGNPHAVIIPEKEELKNIRIPGEPLIQIRDLLSRIPYDLPAEGSLIERADIFPERTNVEFVYPVDAHNICMRVWERGSGETYSCGTGSCAAAAACIINGLTKNAVTVTLLGGTLYVEWDSEQEEMYLTGPADTVFKGEIQER